MGWGLAVNIMQECMCMNSDDDIVTLMLKHGWLREVWKWCWISGLPNKTTWSYYTRFRSVIWGYLHRLLLELAWFDPSIELEEPRRSPTGQDMPRFIMKLWNLVEHPDHQELICWSQVSVWMVCKSDSYWRRFWGYSMFVATELFTEWAVVTALYVG